MAESSWDTVSEAALGLALKRLSPSLVPAHWNSWEGAEASLIPEPDRNSSQRLVTFHSSVATPTSTLGRSSFGTRVAVGAGATSATAGAGNCLFFLKQRLL